MLLPDLHSSRIVYGENSSSLLTQFQMTCWYNPELRKFLFQEVHPTVFPDAFCIFPPIVFNTTNWNHSCWNIADTINLLWRTTASSHFPWSHLFSRIVLLTPKTKTFELCNKTSSSAENELTKGQIWTHSFSNLYWSSLNLATWCPLEMTGETDNPFVNSVWEPKQLSSTMREIYSATNKWLTWLQACFTMSQVLTLVRPASEWIQSLTWWQHKDIWQLFCLLSYEVFTSYCAYEPHKLSRCKAKQR